MRKRTSSYLGDGLSKLAELWKSLRLAWRLFRDPAVSLLPKLIPLTAMLYILFPLDLVPDLVPALGQMDDLAVLMLGIRLFIAACPAQAVQRHMAHMDSVEASYTVVEQEQGQNTDQLDPAALALPEPLEQPTQVADGSPQAHVDSSSQATSE